jgi:hypothetical protein
MEFDAEDFGANFHLYFHKILFFVKKKREIESKKTPEYAKPILNLHYQLLISLSFLRMIP